MPSPEDEPGYTELRNDQGPDFDRASKHAAQELAGVIENSTPAPQAGVTFEDKTNDAKNGLRFRSSKNLFTRLGHELSHESVQEEDLDDQEIRPVPHHYFAQRPRALQYVYKGSRIGYGEDSAPIQHELSRESRVNYTAEGVAKARERVDLFIDLVWVGIITNLTEVYSTIYFEPGEHAGKAFLMFILVFLPAWRIWNFLREFLNSFYMDDTFQRGFIFWILSLSVYFGNQIAFFAEDYAAVKHTLISTYLIIRCSFVAIELFYSCWIPWMRRLLALGFFIMLPSTALWVGALYADGAHAIGPALAAIYWEYFAPMILETPLAEKLLPSEYRKEVDPVHLRSRMGNFLIITIGEGVLSLVKGGVLGKNFTLATSLAAFSLLIYFLLAYLYFQRDGSVRFIPAVRRRGWRLVIWVSFHIPIFASFITLSAGVLWLINKKAATPVEGEDTEQTPEQSDILQTRALWNIGVSLTMIMFSYLCLALLDRPVDRPGTTLINNRFIRLIGRPIYIIIIMSILVTPGLTGYTYLVICGVGLSLIMIWELNTSLEKPAGFMEPRGLTVLMKREYRQERPSRDAGPPHEIRIPI